MIAFLMAALLFADEPIVKPSSASPALTPEQETAVAFVKVRRIYVDILTGGETALRIRDMLMSSIQSTKLFIVTEEEEKADAVLKGAGHDQAFTDVFQSSDNINAHSQISLPTFGSNSGTATQRYSNRISSSIGAGESESQKIEERKHEAMAAVRLVAKNGDVIWSATEESLGAKFAGASVDVVERITKKLAADYRKAQDSQFGVQPVKTAGPATDKRE